MDDDERWLLTQQIIERDKLAKSHMDAISRVQAKTQHDIDNAMSPNAAAAYKSRQQQVEAEMLERFSRENADLAQKHQAQLDKLENDKPVQKYERTQPEKLLADEPEQKPDRFEVEEQLRQERQQRIDRIMQNAQQNQEQKPTAPNPVDQTGDNYEAMIEQYRRKQGYKY